jgi:hypothetical protein
MGRLAWVYSVVLAGLLLALTAGTAQASFPGTNGVVAYTGSIPGQEHEQQIWAIDRATGYQLRLTTGPYDGHPSFSPDGALLVFEHRAGEPKRHRNGSLGSDGATVYVVDSGGSDPQLVANGSEPAFGPDGHTILFVRHGAIYAVHATPGAHPRRIDPGPADSAPTWSVKGQIAFERSLPVLRRYGRHRVHELLEELEILSYPYRRRQPILSFERGAEQSVEDEHTPFYPDWAPDGKRIVLSACGSLLEGAIPTRPRLLIGTSCGAEVWQPDGKHTFFFDRAATSVEGVTSTCPVIQNEFSEISYQPLTPTSPRVPVAPCQTTADGESGVAPAEEALGSRVCYTLHHRRHCRVAH